MKLYSHSSRMDLRRVRIVVSVMSAMGEEQMCALKEVGPK
jgi:hypothetical protein